MVGYITRDVPENSAPWHFFLPGLPLFPSTQRHTSTPPTFDEMEGMVSLMSVIRGIMIETETPISSLRIQLQP